MIYSWIPEMRGGKLSQVYFTSTKVNTYVISFECISLLTIWKYLNPPDLF